MIAFKVLQPHASLRFAFNRVLPSFPSAGTESFSHLCAALEPFGLTVEDISTPQLFSNHLTDSILEFGLFRGEAVIKVGFGWIDLVCKPLTPAILEVAPLLLEAAIKAVLGDWRDSLTSSAVRITYTAHLDLAKSEIVDAFITGHLREAPSKTGLQRDALQYVGNFPKESTKPQSMRLTFAKSLLSDTAIFSDFFLEYSPSNNPAGMISLAHETITETLSSFGLVNAESNSEESSARGSQ